MLININVEDMKKSFDNVYCGNCGKLGHIYRRCTEPITSLGIILFRHNKKEQIEYLMIRRRNTLGFVEFMRGKYNLDNYRYIYNLFSIMTREERLRIVNNNFDYLWNKLWMDKNTKQYHNEYDNSKKKFEALKSGFEADDTIINLQIINNSVEYSWETTEWGFPKGRRNLKETNLDCANREFQEETGLTKEDYIILNQFEPVEEIFLGTNNIRYKHIYFIAKCNSNKNLLIDENNFSQVSEIGNIKWFRYTSALGAIRSYNVEKKDVLKRVNDILHKNNL